MPPTPAALLCAAGLLFAAPASAQVQVTVDASTRRQTIDGFGATATVTWVPEVANLLAQPSFAAQIRDHLGLTIIRVAVPPSIQPAEDLQPAVMNWSLFDFSQYQPTGTLAINLNQGQPGAVKVIGSVWSPPAWMKTNGNINNGGALRADRRPHFAKYLAACSLGFEMTYGVPLFAISPQNEPVFAVEYESCVYTPDQYREAVKAVGAAFANWSVTTRVFGSEDVGTDPPRWQSFVTSLAGDAAAMQRVDRLAIHNYPWHNGIDWTSPIAWDLLRQTIQHHGKRLWVSEISGEDPAWRGTPANPRGALVFANQIHDALVHGEVSAYVYWAITTPGPTEFGLMDMATPTKKYWAARQFYRYIRPGAVRVATTGGSAGTVASAYIHDAERTTTVVLINNGAASSTVQVTFAGGTGVVSFTTVCTSETDNGVVMPPTPVVNGRASVTLPPYSVITLHGAGNTCYPNCDGSTAAPVLNVSDFGCFLQRYAAQDAYANCDGSTAAPILNIADFSCFLTRFAQGCP